MEKKWALINVPLASLRKEARYDSELVDEDFYGRKVEILSEPVRDWFEVRTGYHYTGFVHKSELIFDEDRIFIWDKAYKKVILQSVSDVLALPRYQGLCLITLVRGALLWVMEAVNENGWVKVALCDGRIGFVREKFLGDYIAAYSLADEVSLRNALVGTAFTYMGSQYRWGGKSPLGIDCSGLCSVAYLLNGILIYRDAAIVPGFPIHKIPYEDKKWGDLLYFPGHIAMYIGTGHYIHSTGKAGSDGVVINSLNKGDSGYREDLHKSLKAVGSLFLPRAPIL